MISFIDLISFSELTIYRDHLAHPIPNVAPLEPPKPKGFELSHFNFSVLTWRSRFYSEYVVVKSNLY